MKDFESNTRGLYVNRVVREMPKVQPAFKILDNVLDMGSTIAKILTICGIDGDKATKAVSYITHAFLHFDEKQSGDYGLCKTRHMRKEGLLKNLHNECCMSDTEARLAVSVVKCAFRAFHHKQSVRKYDPAFYSEEDWEQAAERTITAYAKAGATKSELELAARRIQEAYKGYLDRVPYKRTSPHPHEIACNALHRINCYHCSPKNAQQDRCFPLNPTNTPNIPKQVICTCCGCLRKPGEASAAHRNAKGRSILLVEDNNMYYNNQVMKQECDALHQPVYGEHGREQQERNLSRALFKLTRNMINRIIKSGGLDDLRPSHQEGDKTLSNFVVTTNQGASPNKSTKESYKFSGKKKEDDYDSGDKHTVKNRRKNATIHSSTEDIPRDYGSTSPNNLKEIYEKDERHRSKSSNTDAIFEIALKGVCRQATSGRARIDIVGLRLLDNDYGGPLEYVCKKLVRTANRYSQTGALTAGVSTSISSTSTANTPDRRRSTSSTKSRPSKTSIKRKQSFEIAQHLSNSEGSDHDERKSISDEITVANTTGETEISEEQKVQEIYVKSEASYKTLEETLEANTSVDNTVDMTEVIEVKENVDVDKAIEHFSSSVDDSSHESVKEEVENAEKHDIFKELVKSFHDQSEQ